MGSPKTARETLAACPLCREGRFAPVVEQTDYVHHTTDEMFAYVRCLGCGLVFVRERPRLEDMAVFYPSDYAFYRSGRSEALKDALKQVLHAAFTPGASRALGTALWPLRPLARRMGWLNAVRGYRPPAFVPERGARLLDVGCGSGTTFHPFGRRYSLLWLAARGVRAEGVEPDERACAAARAAGLAVRHGDFLTAGLEDGAYDAVRFNHSLEHAHDPAAYLARAARLLKPGGTLVVSVPNYDGWTYSLFPAALESPRHLHYFNPSSLRRHLESAGFSGVRISTPPTPEVLLFVLRAFAPEALASLTPGEEVFELLPACRAAAALGRGDDLDLVARRAG